MKTDLSYLPQHKQTELALITETIRQNVDQLEMIILFGSYARGGWVEDIYTEGRNTYEYRSDFDILAVTATESSAHTTGLWQKVKTAALITKFARGTEHYKFKSKHFKH